jgi:MEMO1 family protein
VSLKISRLVRYTVIGFLLFTGVTWALASALQAEGESDYPNPELLASAEWLQQHMQDRTLVVVSSDFTHYGERFGYTPFREDIPKQIERLDMGAFDLMRRKQAKLFMEYIANTGATICGRAPIAILLTMLPEESRMHWLHYDTSGRMTGDYANTVSYLAAAVTGDWKSDSKPKRMDAGHRSPSEPTLTDAEKGNLLRLARRTLSTYLTNGKRPDPYDPHTETTAGMKQTMGAFVTLHKNGRLRGCIGEILPRRPLYQAVMDHAINSGVNDPRFPPVTRAELQDLDAMEVKNVT